MVFMYAVIDLFKKNHRVNVPLFLRVPNDYVLVTFFI